METLVELELSVDTRAARDARRSLASIGLSPDRLIEAQLIVSELVTNALLHAGLAPDDRIILRIIREGGCLIISVDDRGAFTADSDTFAYSEEDYRNHGLRIVQIIADHWKARHGTVTAWLKL